ncbi:tape measure protein [Weissella confusa]|uniref:phage tail protein n=1 Tax=Weissella confusa TaxID=1583 RepID=UPI001C6F8D7D|nr:tape measure protein [Weissella confusa]QYU58213.1 tape measure protein [Weissella confusa]
MAYDATMTAIVSANIKGFTDGMKTVQRETSRTKGVVESSASGMNSGFGSITSTIKTVGTATGVFKLVDAGLNTITNSVSGAVARFDTLNAYPKIMKQMGFSTKDTNKSIKTLKKGVDGLPTSLQDISKSAQSFAILTKSASEGADVAVALNDAFIASGASAGDASRGVTQYSQMLASGKVDMAGYRSLVETMPSALNAVAKSFGFAGKSAEQDLYKALQSGDITMDQLNQRFIDLDKSSGGFAEQARTASGGIQTSFTNMSNAITNGLADTISAIDKGLKDAGLGGIAKVFDNVKVAINNSFTAINSVVQATIPVIVGLFSELFNFVNANQDWLAPLAIGIGTFSGLVVAINGVAKAITVLKVASSVAKDMQLLQFALQNMAKESALAKAGLAFYNGALKVATGVQTAFNAVMALNPFVLVTVALAALTAGLVWFFTQTKTGQKVWQQFTTWLSSAWSGMVEFFQGIWNGIVSGFNVAKTTLENAWQSTVTFVTNIWQGVSEFFSNLWTSIVTTAQTVWQGILVFMQPLITSITVIWQSLSTFLSTLWNSLVTIASSVWNLIKAAIMAPILLLIDALTGNWSQMKADAEMIWNSITSSLGSIVSALANIVTSYISSLANELSGIWNVISSTASSVWNAIWNTLTSIASSIVSGVSSAWNALPGIASSIWNSVTNTVSSVFSGLIGAVSSIGSSIVSGLTGAWSGLIGLVSGIWNGVKSTITSALNIDLGAAGRAIMQSFLDGLKSVWGAVQDFVGGIAGWIRDHKGPISYDRRLLIPAGQAIMQGFNASLNDGFGTVMSSVQNYATGIYDEISKVSFDEVVENAEVAQKRLVHSMFGGATQLSTGNVSESQTLNQDVLNAPSSKINITIEQNWDGDEVYYAVKSKEVRQSAMVNLIRKK